MPESPEEMDALRFRSKMTLPDMVAMRDTSIHFLIWTAV